MKEQKRQTGIRFSKTADEILDLYTQKLGISKTAVMELALRKFHDIQEKENEKIRN